MLKVFRRMDQNRRDALKAFGGAALLPLLPLSACGGGGPTPTPVPPGPPMPTALPTSPYWKMLPGTWAEFDVHNGAGSYDPTTDTITVTPGSMVEVGSIRITNLPAVNLGAPAIARTFSQPGVQMNTPPANFSGCLVQQYDPITLWIGESGGNGSPVWVPEPVLQITPVVGATSQVSSTVTPPPPAAQFQFISKSTTTYVDATILHSTLIEAPSGIGQLAVYHYIFDGELQDLLYGAIMPGNVCPLLTHYARTSVGVNT